MNAIFLSPFSLLYRAVVRARATLYEREIFKSHALGALTVSIGNITVGGTGKTPLVARVARILDENGERVCVLTRGYKRENPQNRVLVSDGEKILADARKSGDEPAELARGLLGASAVIADGNRVEAGNWARENLEITAFVLDDAFQHRRVKRDLDIVCIDATNPFGNGKTLPLGILREPLPNLKRAHAIVITRANLVEEKRVADLKSQISQINPGCKIFVSANKISNLTSLDAKQIATNDEQRTTSKYSAFCALGNPENFFEQLRREKFDLVFTKAFRDHHRYSQKDVDEMERKALNAGAESFLVTAKDAVKLEDLRFNLPCLVAESEMIFDDEEGFRELIVGAARGKSAAKGREKARNKKEEN